MPPYTATTSLRLRSSPDGRPASLAAASSSLSAGGPGVQLLGYQAVRGCAPARLHRVETRRFPGRDSAPVDVYGRAPLALADASYTPPPVQPRPHPHLDPYVNDIGRLGVALTNFAEILIPCLDAARARSVAEVGAYAGDLTGLLLDWAQQRDATVVAIDPKPQRELEELA